MRIVSNTSPLSNLAIIGRLELLERRYAEVQVPPEVARERAALSHPAGQADLKSSSEHNLASKVVPHTVASFC